MEQGPYVSKWEKVLKGIKSHLEAEENSVNAILELSYVDLHPRLKSCFLYLSFFKEDEVIKARKLIALWIVEGLASQGEGGVTLEGIAKGYLDDLINRNMIQATQFSTDGEVQFCQMHDLLHNLSIIKSKEEINFSFISDENTSYNKYVDKARHLAGWGNNEWLSRLQLKNRNQHLRSLVIWGGDRFPPSYWKIFGVCLKVLEFEDLSLKTVPKGITTLIGLNYLELRINKLEKLPRSLGRLKNLQTLDISRSYERVPNVIWKMESLRHLYMGYDRWYCEKPLRLDFIGEIVVDHVAKLVSLRELTLKLFWDDIHKFSTLAGKFENHVSISVHLRGGGGGECSLDGIVKLADCCPQNLSYLNLEGIGLNEDPMPTLGKLPNLLHLKLDRWSYEGEDMVIGNHGFPRLKILILSMCFQLRQIYIESGGLLQLEQLEITKCENLIKILPEAEQKRMMDNLEQVKISECGIKDIPSVEIQEA